MVEVLCGYAPAVVLYLDRDSVVDHMDAYMDLVPCRLSVVVDVLDRIGKQIDYEYTFDNNKVLFYFTADGRIDFRELVKDLAAVFKTRIELRQIGVRDETKILGGIGWAKA